MTARILIIAGSDSGGGAGIQADIKTVTMLGGHAMTAITAITAQNTLGVNAVEVLSPAMVAAQIDACVNDIGVDAVKIGMLGSADIATIVADRLAVLDVPVVFDPVMIATSGATLADDATIAAFELLMARATVLTPNTEELAAIADMPVTNEIEQEAAAEAIMLRTGCPAILAKGGHLVLGGDTYGKDADNRDFHYQNATRVFDFLYCRGADGLNEWSFDFERIDTTSTHGTGCTLASGIANGLGQGLSLVEAVARARRFVYAALKAAPGLGSGHGPMGHQFVRLD